MTKKDFSSSTKIIMTPKFILEDSLLMEGLLKDVFSIVALSAELYQGASW